MSKLTLAIRGPVQFEVDFRELDRDSRSQVTTRGDGEHALGKRYSFMTFSSFDRYLPYKIAVSGLLPGREFLLHCCSGSGSLLTNYPVLLTDRRNVTESTSEFVFQEWQCPPVADLPLRCIS